ncbi:uncharacterized protein [Antedon mediterranea]|uniref:uncharacterized protein n=1 Tax=Antedon mediterranea TaxID=105859 RepID=UPI003AF8EF1D
MHVVTHLCQGLTFCEVHATDSVFGDNCAHVTKKYLEVIYRCYNEDRSFVRGSPLEGVLLKNLPGASQSSTLYHATADRAIDGKTSGVFNDYTCTHTGPSNCKYWRGPVGPWWKINLGTQKHISKIVIYNRNDNECFRCAMRLVGVEVRVGDDNVPPFKGNQQCGDTIGNDAVASNPIELICQNPAVVGQYVTVRHTGQHCLTLCEVQIYELVQLNPKLFGEVSQSTVLRAADPERAIDGNTNGILEEYSCADSYCYELDYHEPDEVIPDKPPDGVYQWWYVDLRTQKNISKVVLYNREDCCARRLVGAKILVGDNHKSPFTGNRQCGAAVTSSMIASNPVEVICNKPITGRYVSVSEIACLTLCEVQIYAVQFMTNLPRALQSSIFHGGTAVRAIDGNTNGKFTENSCTHTSCENGKGEPGPWWYFNFGIQKRISKIVLYNREDCCDKRLVGAEIRVGNDNTPPFTGNQQCGDSLTNAIIGLNPIEVICDTRPIGQYVSVRLPGNECLSLCEVQIYEAVPVTHFIGAKQSSTLRPGRDATKAIDGNKNGIMDKNSCTHTGCVNGEGPQDPWWYADLGRQTFISKIVLYNREDCCGERLIGADIRVGNDNVSPFTGNSKCGTVTSSMIGSNRIVFVCNKPIRGHYITVRLPGTMCLSICEIEAEEGDFARQKTDDYERIHYY